MSAEREGELGERERDLTMKGMSADAACDTLLSMMCCQQQLFQDLMSQVSSPPLPPLPSNTHTPLTLSISLSLSALQRLMSHVAHLCPAFSSPSKSRDSPSRNGHTHI
jgi:hypothetical protein